MTRNTVILDYSAQQQVRRFFINLHADLFGLNMNENSSFEDWLGLVLSEQRSSKIASNDVTKKSLTEPTSPFTQAHAHTIPKPQ